MGFDAAVDAVFSPRYTRPMTTTPTAHSKAVTVPAQQSKGTNLHWHDGNISRDERFKMLKAQGATLWFTGLSASGKSTIACALEQVLVQRGIPAYRLDGDNIRMGLNKNLGFSAEDRAENIRASARSPNSSPIPAASR